MKLCFVSLVSLTIATAASIGNSTDSAGTTTLTSMQKRYHILPLFKGDWLTANMYCRLKDMRSISISTKEENDQIGKIIQDAGYNNLNFWASGRRFDGRFHWFDSAKQINFTNWAYGEPDNRGDCFTVYNWGWYVNSCSNDYHIMCEEDVLH
ncbi:perlucin-like [Sitodiplosis mosellana]|uniref:perlucin-like n=1 Tax=Sitodiplosis mosellana TaxID=263140 RepID=UPI0024450501|nr:perlucin-like [Sitodiplosis mosellana]